jgi:hypothetical protein
LNQNLKTFFLFLSVAQNHFGPVVLAAHLFFLVFLFSLRAGPSGIRPTWPLRPTRQSSPTSVARAAFGLAGATAPLAAVSRPPVRVRSQNDALPGRILFPHTNSTLRRLPSPYYSLKLVELSSTDPPSVTPRPPPFRRPRRIKAALEHRLHTTFPFLTLARSIRTRIALPPSSVRRRFISPSPGQTASPRHPPTSR